MTTSFDRLPVGSTVLVTGGTGLIGSSVVTALLDKGYNVKAPTRSVTKQAAFQKALDDKYGAGRAHLVDIGDFTQESAWDVLLEGVQGVVHLATDSSFSPEYDTVIKPVIAMANALLSSASKRPEIKSIVFTSSRISMFAPQYGQDVHANKDTWADYFIDLAKGAAVTDPLAPVFVYAASKVIGEKAVWEYVDTHKPHYALNVVLPDYVSGPAANPTPGEYSTHSWLNALFKGDGEGLAFQMMNPSSRLVDVRDVAAVHVGLLLDPTANHKRVFAGPHKFTINEILAIWREAYPDAKILPDYKLPAQPDVDVDDAEGTDLIKRFAGRDWISLKESVLANVATVAK